MTPELERAHRADLYWLGYRSGRRASLFDEGIRNREPTLRLEVRLTDGNKNARAFALGELRGYRQAQK